MSCNCKNNHGERLNFTVGNDVVLLLSLKKEGEKFPVELSENVQVNAVSSGGQRLGVGFEVGDGGKVLAHLDGDNFSVGVYGIEVVGCLNGSKWRTFGDGLIEFTLETVRGGSAAVVSSDPYDVTLEVRLFNDVVPKRVSDLSDGTELLRRVSELEEGGGSGCVIRDAIDVTIPVGGIEDGVQYAEGTEIERVLREMLSPTLFPSLTDPSAVLQYNVPSLGKVGTPIAPSTATVTLNRGSIHPQYTSAEPYRSGAASGYSLSVEGADAPYSDGNTTGIFNVPAIVRGTKGSVTVSVGVEYGEGCQPKDSAGNDYAAPLPSGVATTSKVVNFVYPFCHGVSATNDIQTLDGLVEDLSGKGNKTYSFDTSNEFMVFAYDSAYGNLSSILDPNNFETISGWTKTILGNYNVYVSGLRTTDTGAAYSFRF